MNAPIRVAVLSFAHYHANFWTEVFRTSPLATLTALWDDDPARGAAAAATHHAAFDGDLAAVLAGCDRFTLEIYGEAGTIWLRSGRGPLALHAPGHTGTREWVVPALPARAFGARQHQAFLDIVRGIAPPDTTAADGLASVLVAEAIYQSAELRREVPVGTAGGPA